MKILKLRLKNLNSLKGEWAIDFTQPPFTDNSLFAITGPMGAGVNDVLAPSWTLDAPKSSATSFGCRRRNTSLDWACVNGMAMTFAGRATRIATR